MNVSIPIQAIELAPGSQIVIRNLSWQDFEGLVQDLGEKRKTRVLYSQGTIEIMARLVLYERPHRIIAYIITTILEIQGRNWEDFGLTTFKLPVYILKANGYVESSFSTTFSNLDMTELIPRMLQKAIDNGTRQMLREIRTFLQEKS
jgi:hypothetical protein